MSLRVVADENIPGVEACLGPGVAVTRIPGRRLERDRLARADALLVRSVTRVDEALLAGTPVRFVGSATSGYDHVDRDWLAARGIPFAHAPGSNANSVVEYVLAAIAEVDDFLERLLDGARVGVVGCGHIGRALAARLRRLSIGFCVYDPWLDQGDVDSPGSLEEVLGCAVVSLHPALTREQPWPSFHLLGARGLSQLGRAQLLINASRGPVVDNRALLARLQAADAPAAVLDVWEGEPRIDPALLARAALGSAHIAGYSLDGKLAATRTLCAALARALGLAPPAAPREDGREVVRLDAAANEADALRRLLAARYRLAEDDRRLRAATIGLPAGAAAANFDRLRRDYPVRRELAGSRVLLGAQAAHLAPLVRALGAQPLVPAGAAR